MAKFLDYNGLLYLWGKIKGSFISDITYNSSTDKLVKTKNGTSSEVLGLATSSSAGLMSANDKNTLENIVTTGGEPNQNAFSNISIGGTTLAADSKTDTFTIIAGDNITLASTASSDTFKISATNTTYETMSSAEASAGTSTTAKIITPKILAQAIEDRIAAAQIGAATFKGTVSSGTNISGLTAYSKGWYWLVTTAGTYVGQTCEVGDMIFCIDNFSSSFKNSDFTVIQSNLDLTAISNAEIDTIVV